MQTGMTSLILSAEMSDDCVSKFTFFLKARDYFLQFGVSPVNYSDSDLNMMRSIKAGTRTCPGADCPWYSVGISSTCLL